jgi:hypothetical protein
VIVVLLIVAALVAADRIGLVIAQRTVASQVRTQLASEGITIDGNPTVHIHGFPFLTQVISGHYGRVDISVPDPSSRGVRLDSLDVTATDVSASTKALISGNGRIHASNVVGTGSLSWASFSQLVDLSGVKQYGIDPKSIRLGSSDNGHMSVEAPVSLLGQTFTIAATGTISANRGILHVGVSNVTASDSTLPAVFQPKLAGIARALSFDVRIPQLPYRMALDRVQATASGVKITASAHDVVLGG